MCLSTLSPLYCAIRLPFKSGETLADQKLEIRDDNEVEIFLPILGKIHVPDREEMGMETRSVSER